MTTKPKVWASGLLIGAFLLGGVFGGTVSAAWGNSDRREHDHDDRPGFTEMLTEELGLTRDQADSIEAILESSRPEMCAIWEEYRPRFEALRESIGEQIRTVLTEDQLVRYENWNARVDSARSDRHGGDGRRRGDSRNGC